MWLGKDFTLLYFTYSAPPHKSPAGLELTLKVSDYELWSWISVQGYWKLLKVMIENEAKVLIQSVWRQVYVCSGTFAAFDQFLCTRTLQNNVEHRDDFLLPLGWWFGLVVTRWSQSTSYCVLSPINTWMCDWLTVHRQIHHLRMYPTA